MNKDIDKFIDYICLDLFITKPEIRYVDSFVQSPTMRMAVDIEERVILIKNNIDIDLDFFFDLAHELRHVYQIDCGYFRKEDYVQRQDSTLEEYNKQTFEIDAHAYAAIMMQEVFHVKPLWQGFDSETIELINERIMEILEDDE